MALFGLEGIVLLAILLALLFDFFNGINDAANSIATIVATRVLKPIVAVFLAAVFNFVGPFALGGAVAKAVGQGIVVTDIVTTELIIAAMVGAVAWTWLATRFGIPISVSHSLFGGLMGAGVAAAGIAGLALPGRGDVLPVLIHMRNGAVVGAGAGLLVAVLSRARDVSLPVLLRSFLVAGPWFAAIVLGAFIGSGLWLAVLILTGTAHVNTMVALFLFIFYSPMLGFVLAFVFDLVILWLFQHVRPGRMRFGFGFLQIFSASFYSLSHGSNDGQKTMGVITLLLFANGIIPEFSIPVWVIFLSAGTIALGTLIGGYKVVRTMGTRLTRLEPHQGFAAETSSAIGLFFLARFGVPVSTTHSIAGSIMGVGALRGRHHVRWGVARTIAAAWIVTIPMAGLVAAAIYWLIFRTLGLAG